MTDIEARVTFVGLSSEEVTAADAVGLAAWWRPRLATAEPSITVVVTEGALQRLAGEAGR